MSDYPHAEILVLVEEDKRAQRLCVTWPKAWERWGSSVEAEMEVDMSLLDEEHAFTLKWSSISGVDRDDVARLAPVLFANELLKPYGQVDETVMSFLRMRGDHLAERGPV